MSTPDIDIILARIAKLQALAGNPGATSAEAELAASKIQELLNKYNLTMEQVKPIKQHNSRDVVFDAFNRKGSRIFPWEIDLLCAVVYAASCNFVYTSYVITFIGLPNDVKMAREMYVNFRAVAQHLATKATKDYSEGLSVWDTRQMRGSGSLRTFRLNWLLGFAKGLHVAFKRTKLAEAQAEQLNAIVLIKEGLIQAATDEKYPNLRKPRARTGSHNDHAYTAGYNEGIASASRKTLPE